MFWPKSYTCLPIIYCPTIRYCAMIRRNLLVILATLCVPQFAQAQSQGSEMRERVLNLR